MFRPALSSRRGLLISPQRSNLNEHDQSKYSGVKIFPKKRSFLSLLILFFFSLPSSNTLNTSTWWRERITRQRREFRNIIKESNTLINCELNFGALYFVKTLKFIWLWRFTKGNQRTIWIFKFLYSKCSFDTLKNEDSVYWSQTSLLKTTPLKLSASHYLGLTFKHRLSTASIFFFFFCWPSSRA